MRRRSSLSTMTVGACAGMSPAGSRGAWSRRRSTLRPHVLGAAVAAALVAAVAAASARGSPVRAGGIERNDTWSVVFLALVATAFASYLVALLVLRSRQTNVALVCALAVAIQLVPLGGPLLLSRDAYSYWAYGRIVASHHRSPFADAPARFPHDPATRAVAPAWRRQVSVYGPVFAFASAALADVVTRSAELASLLFRATAALAGIAVTLVATAVARRKAYAAAFVGWNPLLALSFAGGGHNDAWMVVLMLAALALVVRGRDATGGAVWILAAAIKLPALAILPLQLLRARRGVWVGAAGAAVAVGVVATATFGVTWLTPVLGPERWRSRYALTSRLEQLAVPPAAARIIPLLLLGAGTLWLGRHALRGRPRLALGASLLLVTSPWLLPWYSTWPVALAAVDDDRTGQLVALALAAYLLPARIPL